MNRPVIYTDFDGVLNAFPDSKIQRRDGVGHTGWLKPTTHVRPYTAVTTRFR